MYSITLTKQKNYVFNYVILSAPRAGLELRRIFMANLDLFKIFAIINLFCIL